MKKIILILLTVSSVLLFFCSCYSLDGYGYSSTSSSSSSNNSKDEHQVYKSKGVSTKLTDRTITTDDIIYLISDMGDFRSNRYVEELLNEKFSEYGIKCVLTTDKLTGKEEDYSSLLYSLITSTNHQYRMFIELEDLYTYTHGGGISSLETEVLVYWKNDFENQTIVMNISTDCKENKLLHYSDTLEDCLESLCSEIVSQYMKYCKK